jgi:hypothetical protein
MIDGDDCGAISGMYEWQGEPKFSEEAGSSAALSSIDSTWLDRGSNPCRRGGKPVTNRQSYGATWVVTFKQTKNKNNIK